MSPAERRVYLKLQRRASSLSPELRRELFKAWRIIRDSLSDAELERLITSGQLDQLVDRALVDRSFIGFRDAVQSTVERGFKSAVPDLPSKGKINGATAVSFDTLNPRVIDAVRSLDSRVVNTLQEEVRESVRAFVENGLRDGKHPRDIARQLRQIIGMSPTQAENLVKYEEKLRALKRHPLTEAQIAKKLAAYERRAVAFNAETNARTATLDSLKLGQKLTWDDAIAKGVVDPALLWKRWVSVGDSRVRDEHRAMHGEEVPHDHHFSNGEMVPGESTFNCRCTAIYVVKRQAVPLPAAA